ncbi:TolC family protein [bacterium]|nr:TolC family protein [bacterium]
MDRLSTITENNDRVNFYSLPLYVGYSRDFGTINYYEWDKKIEPLRYEISQREFLSNNFDVAVKTVTLFSNLLLAETRLKLTVQNIGVLDSLYHNLRGQNTNQIELQKLLFSKKQGDKLKQEYVLDKQEAAREIKNYLSLPDQMELSCIVPAEIDSVSFSVAFVLEKLNKNSVDLLRLDEQLIETKKYLEVAKARRHDISVNINVGFSGSDGNFVDAYSPLDSRQGFKLGVEMPILNWGENRKKIKQAQIKLEDFLEYKSYQSKTVENYLITINQGFNNQYSLVDQSQTLHILASSTFTDAVSHYSEFKLNSVALDILKEDKDDSRLQYIDELMTYWYYKYAMSKMCLYDFVNNKDLLDEFQQ